jgi:hypothetical protein
LLPKNCQNFKIRAPVNGDVVQILNEITNNLGPDSPPRASEHELDPPENLQDDMDDESVIGPTSVDSIGDIPETEDAKRENFEDDTEEISMQQTTDMAEEIGESAKIMKECKDCKPISDEDSKDRRDGWNAHDCCLRP